MAVSTLIEILATTCSLLYIILLIREKILCWAFGIAGSLLSIYLFIDGKLYSEAVLYSYYVGMGVWGWMRWHQLSADQHNPVVRFKLPKHLLIVFFASTAAIAAGWFFATYTDAQRPYVDAFTTAFSFVATYMEVKKVLETWGYWIVLNAVSIWLYHDRSLDIYAGLTVVYTGLSVVGLVTWLRVFRQQGYPVSSGFVNGK